MIKKLTLVFLINLFFIFFLKSSALALCIHDLGICQTYIGSSPNNICCRDSSCSTGSRCGTISKWNFCNAYECCSETTGSGPGCYMGYCNYQYVYQYTQCSVADSCRSTKYLQPGICSDSGCIKGGDYKICCTYPFNGTICPNVCTGSNTTGVCPSGCRNPGPNVLTCPTSATHTVCSGSSCVTVSGAGTNACSSDPDCSGGGVTHTVCSGTFCSSAPGPTLPPGVTPTSGQSCGQLGGNYCTNPGPRGGG